MAFVDFGGSFLAVNPALCDLVGRSEEALRGTTWQAITHPDDVLADEQAILRARQSQRRTSRLPTRLVRADGDVVSVVLTTSIVPGSSGGADCVLRQAVDITEQRRLQDELSKLAEVVDASADAILSKDLDGTILTWNRSAERMYGYASNEIVGRNVSTIIPAERGAEATELMTRVRDGEPVRNLRTVRRRKDASRLDVSVTVTPIVDQSGAPVRALSVATELSPQPPTPLDVNGTLAKLESALAEARRRELRSKVFLADAAHHLRNPVAGVRACAESLLRGPDAAGRDRLLAEIARETSHLSRLVDRLLQIARLEQGEPLSFEMCDLGELCEDELERARSLGPHLSFTLDCERPLMVSLDPRAIRQCLGALLENARRHAVHRVAVSVTRHGRVASVSVRDDGPGLPQGADAAAFEPFTSLDGKGGFGLGLPLARMLARAHGGDLTYEDGAFVLSLSEGVADDR